MRLLLLTLLLLGASPHLAAAAPVLTNLCEQHIGSGTCADRKGIVTVVDINNISLQASHGCPSDTPTYIGCIDNFINDSVCCLPAQKQTAPCEQLDPYGICATGTSTDNSCPMDTTANDAGSCATAGQVCCTHAAGAFNGRANAPSCLLLANTLGCKTTDDCKAAKGYPTTNGICDAQPGITNVCCLSTDTTIKAPPDAGQKIPELQDPLKGLTIAGAIGRAINMIIGLSGSLALLAFIYGGFLWITAFGNADNVKKGKETIVWAAIGVIFLFASYTLLSYLQSFFAKNI